MCGLAAELCCNTGATRPGEAPGAQSCDTRGTAREGARAAQRRYGRLGGGGGGGAATQPPMPATRLRGGL